jgi:excisionase family DNA binding protein
MSAPATKQIEALWVQRRRAGRRPQVAHEGGAQGIDEEAGRGEGARTRAPGRAGRGDRGRRRGDDAREPVRLVAPALVQGRQREARAQPADRERYEPGSRRGASQESDSPGHRGAPPGDGGARRRVLIRRARAQDASAGIQLRAEVQALDDEPCCGRAAALDGLEASADDAEPEPVAFGSGGGRSHTATRRSKPQHTATTTSSKLLDPHPAYQAAGKIPFLADTGKRALARRSRVLELTVNDVAERLQVSTATVYALCRRHELDYHRISHAIRIPESAVAKYLASTGTASTSRAAHAKSAPRPDSEARRDHRGARQDPGDRRAVQHFSRHHDLLLLVHRRQAEDLCGRVVRLVAEGVSLWQCPWS